METRSRLGVAGAGLGGAFRLLKNTDRNSRVLKASLAGARAFAGSASKVVAQLWHEVTGFLFLCIAVVGASAAIREYRAYTVGKIGPGKVILASIFALMFFYFGVSNFVRSRKKG